MKTQIVKIGNSQGIRIPKPLLLETGLSGEVEIRTKDKMLVIEAAAQPRAGWAKAFRKMAESGDDALLDGDTPALSRWDEDEWEWQ